VKEQDKNGAARNTRIEEARQERSGNVEEMVE